MSHPRRWPSRELVIRIATEEAERQGATLHGTLAGRCRHEAQARLAAWLRILAETGCSIVGLSEVWGFDRRSMQRTLTRVRAREASVMERAA